MTADEMFTKLGYRRITNNEQHVQYSKSDNDFVLHFNKHPISYTFLGVMIFNIVLVDLELFEAISKKIEEMRCIS